MLAVAKVYLSQIFYRIHPVRVLMMVMSMG
jgi:hypothetical protein